MILYFKLSHFYHPAKSTYWCFASFVEVDAQNLVVYVVKFVFVFLSQQFGNKVSEGQFHGKALPTNVYPDCVKEAIRTILDEALQDYPNHDPQR